MEATFNVVPVAIAYLVAVVLGFFTLCFSPRFKGLKLPLALHRKAGAALVMGLGLAGLYFSGKAASGCLLDVNCLGAAATHQPASAWLTLLWLAVALVFSLATLIMVWFDGQLDDHGQRLLDSLVHNQDLDRHVRERTASLMEANLNLVREASDRKAYQDQLARNERELRRSNQDLEHFAYVASHDLQAPLRGVMGFSQLLESRYAERLGDEGKEYLAFIHSSAQQMQSLISGLLAFSRLGQQSQPKEPCALKELMDEALQRLYAVIQERQPLITRPADNPSIWGVRTELIQLLQNLIANAIKFQPGPAPKVDLLVQEGQDGAVVQLTVRDYGIGIAQQHQERIFKIFQRLHTSDEYEGTGIGLALCQKIVQHHGGQIWLDSVPEKGASFYCTLPRAPAA